MYIKHGGECSLDSSKGTFSVFNMCSLWMHTNRIQFDILLKKFYNSTDKTVPD